MSSAEGGRLGVESRAECVRVIPLLIYVIQGESEDPFCRRGRVRNEEREEVPCDAADDVAPVLELVVAVVELLDVPLRDKRDGEGAQDGSNQCQ